MHYKTKISLATLALIFSLQLQAQENLENQNILINQSDIQPISGLYNIEFNKQFELLAEVFFIDSFIYIPTKFISTVMFEKFNLSGNIKSKEGQDYIVLDKVMLNYINNQDMTMSIILPQNLFRNPEDARVMTQRERNKKELSQQNIVNYFNNNYQIYIDNDKNISGYLNTQYSNKNYWSLQNKMLYNSSNYYNINNQSRFVRLSTVYKKEFNDNSSLQIGDIIEDSFGQVASPNGLGFKYATNYFNNNLNSNINDSLPQFSVNGFALTPSLFNLYSNSNSVVTSEMNSGNYNVVMPYSSGYGVYSGYVRDYLGNIQQFNIPYYNSNKLIKAGGFEYSVTAASIRKNPYTKSFDYSKPFISGIAKYGVTNSWTQDFSIHNSSYFKNLYTAANFYINPRIGLFQVGVNYNGDSHKLYNLGWENYSKSDLVFRINLAHSSNSEGFCMGYTNDCIKNQNRFYAGYKIPGNFGILGLQHLKEKKITSDYQSTSINWSKSLTSKSNLTLMYEQIKNSSNQTPNDKRFMVLFTYNFDDKWSGSVNHQNNTDYNSTQFRVARAEDKNNPAYGYGYFNVSDSSRRNSPNYNLNYYANLDHFSYNVQANKINNDWNSRVGIRGSALYIPEDNHLSFNKDSNGIILVDTNKQNAPVEIYHQNKLSGLTDNSGKYIIVKGTPYANEKVELNLKTLPLDQNYEQFKFNVLVPEYGATRVQLKPILADFDINVNLPEGSIFKISDESFVVGKNGQSSVNKDGKAFFINNKLSCSFTVKQSQKEYICE